MSKDQSAHASAAYQPQHDPHPDDDVMLSPTSNLPFNNNDKFQDININASSNVSYIVNASVKGVIESASGNSSTPKAALQSDEFYESYDPSIGLHTAVVLGGILVWLVVYVVYRTKVRKWAIAAFKKKFGDPEKDITKKPVIGTVDSDILSNSGGTHPNAAKPLINPSIIIESSPPQSPTKSLSTYDQLVKAGVQECLSPYSLPAGNMKDDMMIFRFPGQHHNILDHPDHLLHQLPISEMDIPTATAQWVQKMPLAARSYHDYAGLVLNMQARKFLPVDKPGSCPLVNATPPPSLPVLELTNAWNNSLPTLSSSVSDHLIQVYESANSRKELKDLINAKRKLSAALKKNEYSIGENNNIMINEVDSNRMSGITPDKIGNNNKGMQNQKNEKTKKGKRPPGLKIDIPGTKDNLTLINNTSMGTSPVPLPVTPTVTIQNSTKTPSRRRMCNDSNTSLSSSSSDLLLQCPNAVHSSTPPPLPPPIHITGPLQDHTTLACSLHGRQTGCNCDLCFDFCPRCVNASSFKEGYSGSSSLYAYSNHHQCSIRHSRSDDFTNTNPEPRVQRHGSLKESYLSRQYYTDNFSHPSHNSNSSNSPVSHHYRSMSVHNGKPNSNPGFHQRSLSADMSSISGYNGISNRSRDHGSTYSLGMKSPSPNFLRVPDPNSNPVDQNKFFLDANLNNAGHYRGIHTSNSCGFASNKNKSESTINSTTQSLCHGSDRNISYYGSPYRPISPLVDTPQNIIRRHSSNYPFSGIPFCSENNNVNMIPRPSSSSSTYFYPIQQNESSSTSSSSYFFQPVQKQEQEYHQQLQQQQQQQQQQYQYQQREQQQQSAQYQQQSLQLKQQQQQLHQHQQQHQQVPNHTTSNHNGGPGNNFATTTNANVIIQMPDNNKTTSGGGGGCGGGGDDGVLTKNKSSPSTVVMETKL